MRKGFDGYYAKCVDNNFAVSVIFGRSITKADKTSFVQVITLDKSYWFKFNHNEYKIDKKKFSVSVKDNIISNDGIILNLDNDKVRINCDIKFGKFSPIKYNAMGVFRFFPFMECRHRIISMNHKVSGAFSVNDNRHRFNNAKGYIEGDFGKSFPKRYLWSQCNSFAELPNLSIAVMCATIPYLGLCFRGTISIIHLDGREYRLATYLGARVCVFKKDKLVITQGFGRKRKRVEITAVDIDRNMNELFAPTRTSMNRVIKESIITLVRYRFTIGSQLIFDIESDKSAFEYGNNNE